MVGATPVSPESVLIMTRRTSLALAVMALSVPALAASAKPGQRVASLNPVMVESRGGLTTVAAPVVAVPLPATPAMASPQPVTSPASLPTAPAAPATQPEPAATVSADASAALSVPAAPALPPMPEAPAAIVPAAAVIPETLPAATPAPGSGRASDVIWRKILLGTWQAVDSPDATAINGEATFTPDGRAVGYTTATYAYQDGSTSDVKVSMSFRWKIKDGVIILDEFDSDPPGFIKKTQVRRFEIKSMNDTGAVFKDLDDGQEIYRRRKPG